MTSQKFIGIDFDYEADVILYSRVLEELIETFDTNWPVSEGKLNDAVRDLIIVEGSTCHLLNEALLVLTQALKNEKDHAIIRNYALILEQLMKSDALLSAILKSSRNPEMNALQQSTEDEVWQSLIQILVSLPNRIANKMERDFLDIFRPKTFADLLCYHTLRAFRFLEEADRIHKIDVNTNILSMILNKMFLIMNSSDLNSLIDVIIEWCTENTITQKFVQQILNDVESHAVGELAVIFLKHPLFVPSILSPLLTNTNWKHALVTKIPFFTFFKDDRLVSNLVYCIYESQTSENRILVELTTKLLEIWADQSALNHSTFDQHFYITKIIILCIKLMKDKITPSERDTIHQLVFAGVPVHLGSPDRDMRAVGMITGEILSAALIKLPDAPKLNFEYEGMGENALEIVETLKNLKIIEKDEKKESEGLFIGEFEFVDSGSKKVYELGIKCNIFECLKTSITKKTTEKLKHSVSTTNKNDSQSGTSSIQNMEVDFNGIEELDSDDDLIPFDMSNDVKSSEKLKPLYLRDLRDNLVNVDSRKNESDADLFEETLKVSESLILSQLPKDDSTFAVELLEIFLNLTERSACDNFEVLTFRACVAIVVSHPKETSKYICQEFHTELSRYSIQQRLLMLNILCESADQLSKIKFEDESEMPQRKKIKPNSKPISLFIETDKSRKYETLYDDDYDDPIEPTKPSINWKEVIEDRIQLKTRHFAHESKRSKTTINKFSNYVESFFFPLIYGLCDKGSFVYDFPANYRDQESLLLARFLETLATIMAAAQNCSAAPKIAKEMVEMAWVLRYHDQARVRQGVIKCVLAVLIAVPEFVLKEEMLKEVLELRLWLLDVVGNAVKGDTDIKCRELAKNVLYLLESLLQGSMQVTPS